MTYTIDRIEGLLAVLENEDGETRHVPVSALPETAREGDLVTETEPDTFSVDEAATEARRQRIRELEALLRAPSGSHRAPD